MAADNQQPTWTFTGNDDLPADLVRALALLLLDGIDQDQDHQGTTNERDRESQAG